MTRIRISGGGSVSIRIGRADRVRIDAAGGVEIVVDDGLNATVVSIGPPEAGGRGGLAGPGSSAMNARVTPAMEAAAIRSFLEGADTARLGRSLADVYTAMEATRRTVERPSDEEA